jgi:hypothetical protein
MNMSELPIKLTTKAGAGYDAPWLTVDALDPDELALKAKSLIEHPTALALAIELANTLKAVNSAAPIAAPEAASAAPVQQAPPPQQAWGQTPAAQQQNAAPQQNTPPQRNQYAGQPHPEGKTCDICPNVLEKKKSQGGKEKWQCPDWRWNNGSPNGHSMEWIG